MRNQFARRFFALTTTLTLALAPLTAGPAIAAAPDTIVIGLPADCAMPPAPLEAALVDTVGRLPPGRRIVTYIAPEDLQLSDFTTEAVPAGFPPGWLKTHTIEKLGPTLAAIRKSCHDKLSSNADSPIGPGNLMLPQFLRDVGHRFDASAGPLSIVAIGNGRYANATSPMWDFAPVAWPSDGHIGKEPRETPFGTRTEESTLARTAVALCTTNPWVSETFESNIRRFWNLFVTGMGGKLAIMTGDLAGCLERGFGDGTALAPALANAKDRETTMFHLADNGSDPFAFLRPATPLSTEPPMTTRGLARLGIAWDCPCDLDLYARVDGTDRDFIFFGNPHGPVSTHLHDYTAATTPAGADPNQSAWEVIDFNQPIDITALRVFVNLYSGGAPHVTFRLRLQFQGQVYGYDGKIQATTGDHGARQGLNPTGPAWTPIDIGQLLHLRPS